MTRIEAVLLCAGSSDRMGFDKLNIPIAGKTAIERSLEALIAGGANAVAFVVNAASEKTVADIPCSVPSRIVEGGRTRRESVRNALESGSCDIVVIHDAARCLVTPEIVGECIRSAVSSGSGIAAIPVVDTLFRSSGESAELIDRAGLYRMQTPQAFRYREILEAYRLNVPSATDDCTLYLAAGHVPCFVPGSEDNFKLTYPEDLARAQRMLTRYGTGFDTHRLVEGRKLILGGVEIPFEKGLLGHSDADVLAHAVMDALLGAGGLPDIGHLFPDTDPAYKDADSMRLLCSVRDLLNRNHLSPLQVSAEIIAQKPKMAPYLDRMRDNLSSALSIPPENVSLSATTTEGMNDEGRGLCISVRAVASLL